MDVKKGVKRLEESSFKAHPLWRFDDKTHLHYPIFSPEEFPEYDHEISISAKFYSPMGMTFNGYLVGEEDIYCIGLFFKGSEFIFNKNLTDLCLKDFKQLRELLSSNKKILISDIFPLKYETTINFESYNNNLTGEFDAFEENSKQP